MKAHTIIIIFLSLVFFNHTNAQDSRNNANTKQVKDKSRQAVASIGSEINKLVAANEWSGAEAALQRGFDKCAEMGDPKLCVAGMNFNGGFLFQQMTIKRKKGTKKNQKRAIEYYEEVLRSYPDNQSAMSNLVKLQELDGVNESTIELMEELAEIYPAKRVDYLTRIGNLYLEEKSFEDACNYYFKAYSEDPFAEEACAGMVDLYTRHDFGCGFVKQLELFAYNCSEIGLPNYSEELVRKQIVNSFNQEDYSKTLNSIVLWAYILGENGWLRAKQVSSLQSKLFRKKAVNTSNEKINSALIELSKILQLKNGERLASIDFWDENSPSLTINEEWDKIRPVTALLKILYSKGKKAQVRKNVKVAEQYWQQALEISYEVDQPFYSFVASDIASLYHANRAKLDPNDQKMDELIKELFEKKGESYSEGDYEMIGRYHTTLGGIYYDRKTWEGRGAASALFQLKRATSKKYGYKLEPNLKRMLGDTYMAIKSWEKGIDTYQEVIEEYLSLDQIKKANNMYKRVTSRYQAHISSRSQPKWDQLANIISLRKELASKENKAITSGENIFTYLTKVSIVETEAKKSLDKKFVEMQVFKGLSDLAAQIPEERLDEQQMVYSSAFEKIADKNELCSPGDFFRIKSITTSFESKVEGSSRMNVAQMNRKADLKWNDTGTRTGYKVYQISALKRQIEVPVQLYELNGLIQSDLKTGQEVRTAEYKYKQGKFEKVFRG